jgi:hypothetical protein
MKKISIIIFAVLLSFASFSQGNSNKNTVKNNAKMHKENPNGVMMQNGRMMLIIKGQTTYLDSEVTMSNGTRVFPNGNIIKKNGSIAVMTEGQHMNLGGNMIPMRKIKIK